LVYQQLILGNYWFRAELFNLVINGWFNGICGFGFNNGNVANGCSMGFGASQQIKISKTKKKERRTSEANNGLIFDHFAQLLRHIQSHRDPKP